MGKAYTKEDFASRVPAKNSEYWAQMREASKTGTALDFVTALCWLLDESVDNVGQDHYLTIGATKQKTFLSYTVCKNGARTSGYAKDIAGLLRAIAETLHTEYVAEPRFVLDEDDEDITQEDLNQ